LCLLDNNLQGCGFLTWFACLWPVDSCYSQLEIKKKKIKWIGWTAANGQQQSAVHYNRTEKDQMDWMDFAANGQQQSAVHYK
jgi:hypothetical protein